MIKIEDIDDMLLIKCSVTDFIFCMTYCEYKIPFYMRGVTVADKESEERKWTGKLGHIKEEEVEMKKIEKGDIQTVSDAELFWILSDMTCDIEFIREDVFTKLSYSTQIDEKKVRLILTGRADKILRIDGCLIVNEDKFPKDPSIYLEKNKPFNGQVLQALIYLNSKFVKRTAQKPNRFNNGVNIKKLVEGKSWFEIPHTKKKWIVNIRKTDGDDNVLVKTFEGIPNGQDDTYLGENLSRFVNLVLGKKEISHHNNFKKCVPCEYSKLCQFSLR